MSIYSQDTSFSTFSPTNKHIPSTLKETSNEDTRSGDSYSPHVIFIGEFSPTFSPISSDKGYESPEDSEEEDKVDMGSPVASVADETENDEESVDFDEIPFYLADC